MNDVVTLTRAMQPITHTVIAPLESYLTLIQITIPILLIQTTKTTRQIQKTQISNMTILLLLLLIQTTKTTLKKEINIRQI